MQARCGCGEVAHHAQAACVGGVDEPTQGLVAAQELVDVLEGGRVVAMVGLGGEEGGEVDDVGAKRGDVVEAFGHAVEVAAVDLAVLALLVGAQRLVPGGAERPVG